MTEPLSPAPRVALVADAHLNGPGGSPEGLYVQLRELPGRGCQRLVLLGDLFHVWVGHPQFAPPGLAGLLELLAELRAAGVVVDYVEGNRDFFIARSGYAAAFAHVGLETRFAVAGVRYLVVHGDGLDEGDRQYRLWRWLSKSLPVRVALRALPAALARRLVSSTEARLAQTNFKHRIRIPEAAIRRYAERRLSEGHDVLLLGHFHEQRHWQVAGGRVWLLPAWFHTRRVEWLDGEGGVGAPVGAATGGERRQR